MDLTTLAYAKLNLEFDKEAFIKEYDERILPVGRPAMNSKLGLEKTARMNREWNMVPEELYFDTDYFEQPGDIRTIRNVSNGRPVWNMFQILNLDISNIADPLLRFWYDKGTAGLRNETLDEKYNFYIKPGFEDLKIVQWIYDTLPFKKIKFIHCVAMEANSFASIHRDSKSFRASTSSAGVNKVFNAGYVVINLNISNGGVPLYWSLDGKDLYTPHYADDDAYITNDYFFHGVPICTSRRRQIRITGIPTPELVDLIDNTSAINVGNDYQFVPGFPED